MIIFIQAFDEYIDHRQNKQHIDNMEFSLNKKI